MVIDHLRLGRGAHQSTTHTSDGSNDPERSILSDLINEVEKLATPSELIDSTATDTINPTIYNLSTLNLSESAESLLSKGLKFTPTPQNTDDIQLRADILAFSNKVKKRVAYGGKLNNNYQQSEFVLASRKSNKAPPKLTEPKFVSLCQQIENVGIEDNKVKPNMEKAEYEALKNLVDNDEILIKSADKGSGVVIMDKEYYNEGIQKLLSDTKTYQPVDNMDLTILVDKVDKFVKSWSSVLTKEEKAALTKQQSSIASFYGLPKIHKSKILADAALTSNSLIVNAKEPPDVKFRPIVSCRLCPTSKLCEALNNILQPLVKKVKFRLKDTWDFLRSCPDQVEEDTFLVSADISSLYTNITTEKGAESIGFYWDQYAKEVGLPARITKEFVLDLYTFCQENLYFEFCGQIYRQVSGTGMGKIFAPALADLKIGKDEIDLENFVIASFPNETAIAFLESYFRYLDDVIFRWRTSYPGLDIIKQKMNLIDPNIKYIFQDSLEDDFKDKGLPYLDVLLKIEGSRLTTDIYAKETDTFNYLPFSSSHPRHCTRNIPFSLARRIKGIVSEESRLEIRMTEMKDRLIRKGYPKGLINGAIKKAMSINRHDILFPVPKTPPPPSTNTLQDQNQPIHYVSTFNVRIKDTAPLIRTIIGCHNVLNPEDMPLKAMASYRKSPSLKDSLMFKGDKSKNRVKKCLKNCLLCREYLVEGNSLKLKNGFVLSTNGSFTCSSRNVVYIAICDGCGEFYIGETGDKLSNRFAVHRQQGKIEADNGGLHADQHFRVCGNNKYSVFPFYRPRFEDVTLRREHEEKWIRKLKPVLNGTAWGR